jgi:hypothetical protein
MNHISQVKFINIYLRLNLYPAPLPSEGRSNPLAASGRTGSEAAPPSSFGRGAAKQGGGLSSPFPLPKALCR